MNVVEGPCSTGQTIAIDATLGSEDKMTDLTVSGAPDALAYLQEVATEMVLLFPITMEEARARINRHFEHQVLLSKLEVNMLLHEEQDTWAKHVYYGRESFWWLDEQAARPLGFP